MDFPVEFEQKSLFRIKSILSSLKAWRRTSGWPTVRTKPVTLIVCRPGTDPGHGRRRRGWSVWRVRDRPKKIRIAVLPGERTARVTRGGALLSPALSDL